MGLRHIILTRYNLPLSFKGYGGTVDRADWLGKRKVLFERYCLPSVKAQTSRNFRWFIGFAPDTPQEHLEGLEGVATAIHATSNEEFADRVCRHVPNSAERTIISRLDNDDALGVGYVETVQALAEGIYAGRDALGVPHVITFRRGWMIDDRTGEVHERDYPRSSFFSFLLPETRGADLFRVQAGPHAQVHKHFPVTNVGIERPMWLISVHGDNVGNRLEGTKIDPPSGDLEALFGVRGPAA